MLDGFRFTERDLSLSWLIASASNTCCVEGAWGGGGVAAADAAAVAAASEGPGSAGEMLRALMEEILSSTSGDRGIRFGGDIASSPS